jgi:V/A-type H+-transporting ATPase subunit E
MNNIENLEGIVLKLKEQGIEAGESEKKQIIENAKQQADDLISIAKLESDNILRKAKNDAALLQQNTQAALQQASRDMVEATKVSVLEHLKQIFGKQCNNLFTQEQYMQEILNAAVKSIPGDKEVAVPAQVAQSMEDYLIDQSLQEEIKLKPLQKSESKIEIHPQKEKGMQYVVSSQDIENGLFSLLNKDLVELLSHNGEE